MDSFGTYTIYLNYIKHNVLTYKKIDPKSKICAVVKANAYGIGVKNVVPAVENYVDYFAVANIIEAREVRALTQKPILILNYVPLDCIAECIKKHFEISVSTLSQAKKLKRKSHDGKINVHLAVDTGMHRLGFDSLTEFERTLQFINGSKNIVLAGIFSHIYNAKSKTETIKQNRIFMQYIDIAKKHFDLSQIIVHMLASEGAVKYPQFRYNMVRLGILLYADFLHNGVFKDAIAITSKIIAIKTVKVGDCVGYNKKFIAKKETNIAIVPVGYADGFFRCFYKRGAFIVNKKLCLVVGNICMDMLALDLGKMKARVGDKVVLLGNNNKATIKVADIASWQQTICYEVLTNIKQNRFKIIKKQA